MAVKTWTTTYYGQWSGGFTARILHEDATGHWHDLWTCPHDYSHNLKEALACGAAVLTCYHCSQPITGEVVWDADPGGPAFHPQCAASAQANV